MYIFTKTKSKKAIRNKSSRYRAKLKAKNRKRRKTILS